MGPGAALGGVGAGARADPVRGREAAGKTGLSVVGADSTTA